MTEWIQRIERLEEAARAAERRARCWQWAAALLPVGVLASLPLQHVAAAPDESQAGGVPALEERITVLEATAISQATQITALQSRANSQASEITALQTQVAAQADEIATLQDDVDTQDSEISGLEATVAGHGSRISNLEAAVVLQAGQVRTIHDKLIHFTRDGDNLYIIGANLHLRNGLGATETVNTLGNLIVGYYEPVPAPGSATRGGSHNVIVGPQHSWTSYGGLVAGFQNRIEARFATVTGGYFNIASGEGASVSGGFQVVQPNNGGWSAGFHGYHVP